MKNTKQRDLKKYIFTSVTKIQSLVRGFIARKYKFPAKKAIKGRAGVLEGAAMGWKTRRILKL